MCLFSSFSVLSYKFCLVVRHLWSFVVVIVVAVAFSVVSYELIGTRPKTMHTKMNNAWFIYAGQSKQNRTEKYKMKKENRHKKTWNPTNLSFSRMYQTRCFIVEHRQSRYITRYYYICMHVCIIYLYVLKYGVCAGFKYCYVLNICKFWRFLVFTHIHVLFTIQYLSMEFFFSLFFFF